jgi:DNA-binding XRE family transcriptional regulator
MPKPGGTIYAIGAVGTSWVKIGCTMTAVEKRRKTLQTGQPFPLHVLAAVTVAADVVRIEKRVHAFLIEEQRRGEWFDVPMDTATLEALIVRAVQYIAEADAREAQHLAQKRPRLPVHMRPASLGRAIMQARIDKGWQQKDLHEATGLSQKYLSEIELDKVDPRFSIVKRIARALGVSMDRFVTEDEAHD